MKRFLLPLLLLGCVDPVAAPPEGQSELPITILGSQAHSHGNSAHLTISDWTQTRLEAPFEFQQLGLVYDAVEPGIDYRVRNLDGWSSWKSAEVTWSEGKHRVARILLDSPAQAIELRPHAVLEDGRADFHKEIVASQILARDLPLEEPVLTPVLNAIAPRSLVIPRAEWGARNPDKVCGVAHDPYRMSVHHTAGPVDDGPDPAARMRQMQAYHIDSNGWCDIGYHFVASQSGLLYQGISNEARTGIHVGNQNTGNIGISLIGNFQTQTVGQPQFEAVANIVRWVGDTYGIALNRTNVKGHQEWPGQSTSCPGSNMLNRLGEMLTLAGSDPVPPEPENYDVEITTRWLGESADFYQEGSSAGKADYLIGERFQAEILVTNNSDGPIRGVEVDYWLESPYLRPVGYEIQTDHPEKDKATWKLNDADSAEGNPPKTDMPATAKLTMYAFGAGETKRVLIDVEASQYSIGAADHPDIRAWVRKIDERYVEQTEWNQTPALNTFNKLLQHYTESDVLSPYEWQFNSDDMAMVEGWSSCGGGTDSVVIVPDSGVLRATNTGAGCLSSPAWTLVDTAEWDQLVLKMSTDQPGHRVAVFWAAEGEEVTTEKSVEFAAKPNGIYVIPLAQNTAWTGEVQQLRIVPLVNKTQGIVNLDAVFFQSSAREETSSSDPFVGEAPVSFAPAAELPQNPETPSNPDPIEEPDQSAEVEVSSGCASASGNPGILLLLLGLVQLFVRRRKQ